MPLTRFAADAFSVVTICLVALLILLGLLCIVYSIYFRTRINRQEFVVLNYFSGPWIIRIILVLIAIWWGLGEIIRLGFVRRTLHLKWKDTICKCYIVSNLGFAEPCLFFTLVFLLCAPLQKMDIGIMGRKWNGRTAGYVLLCSLPVFLLQLLLILVEPLLEKNKHKSIKISPHFTRTAVASPMEGEHDISLCTYPLLNTILLGFFTIVLTAYLFWLGRRILKLVINKGLQRRVYTLILCVSSFLPLRVLFLGLSVLSAPDHFPFEALSFLAFLSLLCCIGVCISILVYCPAADSLALGNLQDTEARRRVSDDPAETTSLIANQSHLEDDVGSSCGMVTDTSLKHGSISFRTFEKDGTGPFVELSLFSPSRHSTPPGSPPLLRWPMLPRT